MAVFINFAAPPALGLALCLITLLGLLVSLTSILRHHWSPLRRLPGPFWARYSRAWYFIQAWNGNFHETNRELHKKYGPIVRIAPDTYSIDDPTAVRTIYGHGTKFKESKCYIAFGDPKIVDLFTTRDPVAHANLKRKVANLYATTSLLRMETNIDDCIDLLVSRFTELAEKGTSINLQHWMQCYAFDVIGNITVGKRFGFLDKGEDNLGIFQTIHGYLKYAATVSVYSEFHSTFFKILNSLSSAGLSQIAEFAQKQMNSRLKMDEQSKKRFDDDVLAKALQLHEADPERFPMSSVFLACFMNITAGSDTISISLTSILYNLAQHPLCLQKLRIEIDQYFLHHPDHHIPFSEAQKLPYLQACIKEALRIHPVTGLPLGRVVPKDGATVAGTFFPEGTTLGINTWVAHANTSVFGPDACSFRPERWLEASKEDLQKMETYFLTFGHGSRTCIGKSISLVEMTKLVPILVSKFDICLTHPDNKLLCENVWFVKQNNAICNIQLRHP